MVIHFNSDKDRENVDSCFKDARVLVVDDDKIISLILHDYINELGAKCAYSNDSEEAARLIQSTQFDVVLTDIYMPHLTGHDLLAITLKAQPYTPVVLMTGHPTLDNTIDALRMGAYDYLVKPFNLDVVQLTLKRALEYGRMALENKKYQQTLELQVQERTQELQDFLFHSVQSLSLAMEARDPYTQGHGKRVSDLLIMFANELGVPETHDESLRLSGQLHDIGKIGVPDVILLKKEKLDPAEYDIMKDHVYIGYKILSPIPALEEISRYVYEHHERIDGKGYPQGLRGEDIHFNSRILAVAEVFDALATERCYKPAWPISDIKQYFAEHAGTAYDPDVCKALNSILSREGEVFLKKFQTSLL
jgi:putative two-component system response regulator